MEANLSSAIVEAKACLHTPQRTIRYTKLMVELFGPEPEEYEKRQLRRYAIAAYIDDAMKNGRSETLMVEMRVLYNVSPDLTGDRSGLWGDASGLTGRVNSGTTGNVTGLNGSLQNIWGDVSNIYGSIHKDLYGTVTNLMGDISNKWGYCSLVSGDVTLVRRDLTYFEGCLTGLSGDRYDLQKHPALLEYHGVRLVRPMERELRNHYRHSGHNDSWKRTWGDGRKASGMNTGVVGDVSNVDYNITGMHFDTAFVPAKPSGVSVEQIILPREGSIAA